MAFSTLIMLCNHHLSLVPKLDGNPMFELPEEQLNCFPQQLNISHCQQLYAGDPISLHPQQHVLFSFFFF